MAQIRVLKIASDGVPLEHTSTTDDITFASFTVQGGGPVLNADLDMNNGDINDVDVLSFTDPTTDGITQTAGLLTADNIMGKDRENIMTTAGSVAFPVIADSAGEVDAFRLPAIAGAPTASPTNGGEGHLVWDSTNDKMYAWTGSMWDDLSTVQSAQAVCNIYTADEALSAGDVVYISAADNVSKADVSGSTAASRVLGVAKAAAADTADVEVCSDGVVASFAGLTAGARYFADPATPGGVTTTTPIGAGNTICQVGYAKNATTMHLQIAQLGRRS